MKENIKEGKENKKEPKSYLLGAESSLQESTFYLVPGKGPLSMGMSVKGTAIVALARMVRATGSTGASGGT